MAIKVTPIEKNEIFLQDLDGDFRKIEGEDCPDSDKAWVSVRQATEGDAMKIADLRSSRTVQWIASQEGQMYPQEKTEINERRVWCHQAFLCLTDAGNILDENGELFRFKNGRISMTYGEFKKAWGKLDDVAVYVILKAIYALNPQWDWLWAEEEKQGEVYKRVSE